MPSKDCRNGFTPQKDVAVPAMRLFHAILEKSFRNGNLCKTFLMFCHRDAFHADDRAADGTLDDLLAFLRAGRVRCEVRRVLVLMLRSWLLSL